jgi:ADP-ribosylglycohydrolase
MKMKPRFDTAEVPLKYDECLKKVRGCFVGKAVGGTLGMPREGNLETGCLSYYDPVPEGMVSNDDLDLQIVWLEAIRRGGLPVNRRYLADAWQNNVYGCCDEYGVCRRNLRFGLFPPVSGYYDNKFYAGMGSAIRTEIWAALCPGDADSAVKLAAEDASCDHYDDGLHAALFIAALESAAFTESNPDALIQTGLSYIPPSCRLARGIGDVVKWCKTDRDIFSVRKRILDAYYVQNWTDVTINLSFIIAAWLLNQGNFGKSICGVVNLGYDTDCTGATLGAILGLLNPGLIDDKWIAPIGDDVVVSVNMIGIHEPGKIQELSRLLMRTGEEIRRYYNSKTIITEWPESEAVHNELTVWAKNDRYIGIAADPNVRKSLLAVAPLTVKLLYGDAIALESGKECEFTLDLSNPSGDRISGTLKISAPLGFLLKGSSHAFCIPEGGQEQIRFTLAPPIYTNPTRSRRRSRNMIDFEFSLEAVKFSVSAGMVLPYPWLRVKKNYASDACPPPSLFKDAEKVDAPFSYQPVPPGEHLYAIEFSSHAGLEINLLVQGTRPIKAWLDGNLVLQHDGSEYVPAFHRVGNNVFVKADYGWHTLIVKAAEGTEPGELFAGFAQKGTHEWFSEFEYRRFVP